MLFYLPERIYNVFENDETYLELVNKYEEKLNNATTFRECMEAYSVSADNKDDFDRLDSYIKGVLKSKDPILYEEYLINDGYYTKDQMIAKYINPNDDIDVENSFYLLSNIINKSYEGTTDLVEQIEEYEYYIKEYKKHFESLEDKSNLSKYIYLKYMYAAVWELCDSIRIEDIESKLWYSRLLNRLKDIYNDAIERTNDESITMNYFVEAFCDGMQKLYFNYPTLSYKPFLNEMEKFINSKNFQYRNYSYSILKFAHTRLMESIFRNNQIEFYSQGIKIFNYIQNAFNDIQTLLRGLGYYDKLNQNMFCILTRFYINLKDICPVFKNISLDNISSDDYDFIMSNAICDLDIKDPNKIPDMNFKETADDLNILMMAMPSAQRMIQMGLADEDV